MRDNQQRATGSTHIEVHAALIVRKHTVGKQTLHQRVSPRGIVTALNPHEGEQTVTNASDRLAVDLDRGMPHPLDQRTHAPPRRRGSVRCFMSFRATAIGLLQEPLAYTDVLRGNLDKLIIRDELEGLLERHADRRRQHDVLV